MSSTPSRWRAPVTGAVAGLVVAAAIVGPSALASSDHSAAGPGSGGHAASRPGVATKAPASDASCTTRAVGAKGAAADPGPAPFFAAVAQMVQAGTITAAQAHVIDADIRAGRIDPQQVVASGTLTAAQMQAVGDRLGAVKRSLAPAGQNSAGEGSGAAKAPQG